MIALTPAALKLPDHSSDYPLSPTADCHEALYGYLYITLLYDFTAVELLVVIRYARSSQRPEFIAFIDQCPRIFRSRTVRRHLQWMDLPV